MNQIPEKAFRLGAETFSLAPISYGKSRISGSKKTTYLLHGKGGCMPGQKKIFSPHFTQKPSLNLPLSENKITSAFKRKALSKLKPSIGPKYSLNALDLFTYDEFSPNDDDSLIVVINSAYRQVMGNMIPMESERPIEIERRLRNGDLSVKEFIRQLAYSNFYKRHYFEGISQLKSIEYSLIHILGRPLISRNELIRKIELINDYGFDYHIDSLIDSGEYNEIFGENIVPYMRSWNSPANMRSYIFTHTALRKKAFATSDNYVEYKPNLSCKMPW